MLIMDDNNKPVILDSIYTPTLVEHMWVLDLEQLDYTLEPLMFLEEITTTSIELDIMGYKLVLPANWNILVCDSETMQIDIAEVSEVVGKGFEVMLYGPNHSRVKTARVSATNYHSSWINVSPSFNKHQMMCHPVAPETWISIAPSDTYKKYLKNLIAGDLI